LQAHWVDLDRKIMIAQLVKSGSHTQDLGQRRQHALINRERKPFPILKPLTDSTMETTVHHTAMMLAAARAHRGATMVLVNPMARSTALASTSPNALAPLLALANSAQVGEISDLVTLPQVRRLNTA
jgi:hypothetical protein